MPKVKDCEYVKIPFPEEIVAGWMKDLAYLHDFTLDCISGNNKYLLLRVYATSDL